MRGSYGILGSAAKIDDFCDRLLTTLNQIARQNPYANNRTLGVAFEYAKGIHKEIYQIRDCCENALSNLGGIESPDIVDITHSGTPGEADTTCSTTPASLPERTPLALSPGEQPSLSTQQQRASHPQTPPSDERKRVP